MGRRHHQLPRCGDGGELGSTPKTFGVGEACPERSRRGCQPKRTYFYSADPFVPIRTDSEELNYETRKSGGLVKLWATNQSEGSQLAAVFRLRGRFGDFGAAPLRTAVVFCAHPVGASASPLFGRGVR